jgi:hypothetical protein
LGVSLFLFGIWYHLHLAIDLSRVAVVQVWIWIVGTIILTIGVALVHSGHDSGNISLIVLGDVLLFGWLVFRDKPVEEMRRRSAVPAE